MSGGGPVKTLESSMFGEKHANQRVRAQKLKSYTSLTLCETRTLKLIPWHCSTITKCNIRGWADRTTASCNVARSRTRPRLPSAHVLVMASELARVRPPRVRDGVLLGMVYGSTCLPRATVSICTIRPAGASSSRSIINLHRCVR